VNDSLREDYRAVPPSTGLETGRIEPPAGKPDGHPISAVIVLGVIAAVFFIQYTLPIRDGDLWWQMAYARDFLDRHTLVADHGAFSWTEVDARPVYCAWISQLVLYGIHEAAGLPGLFVLRYLAMAVHILLFWLYARKIGLQGYGLTWLVCLMGLLMSVCASLVKPELFSYALICLMVYLWFVIKTAGEPAYRSCYLFPLIILFWVNAHGGFIFGCLFLFMVGVGETLNALFSPAVAMSRRLLRHLLASCLLSLLAVFATPYGHRYPHALLDGVSDFTPGHYAGIHTWGSIFSDAMSVYHYVDFLIAGCVLLGVLLFVRLRRGRFDWALLLVNLLMIVCYLKFIRSSYLWVPVLCFSTLFLLRDHRSVLDPANPKLGRVVTVLVVLVALLLGGRSYHDRFHRDYEVVYPGFGLSDYHPVEEADFIDTHLSAYRIGNDYNIGGYLVWRLGPEKKLLIDSRSFPFRRWLDRYYRFEQGIDVRGFLDEHRADVWIIWHQFHALNRWFLGSPDWRLVYYGDSAMVYAGAGVELATGLPHSGRGIHDIRNFLQATAVLRHAVALDDWPNVDLMLAAMKERFTRRNQQDLILAFETLGLGLRSYEAGSYGAAVAALEKAKSGAVVWNDRMLANAYMQLAWRYWADDDLVAAKQIVDKAVRLYPESPSALYNAGVVNWYLGRAGMMTPRRDIVDGLLGAFIASGAGEEGIPESVRQIADAILADRYDAKPPILRPPAPKPPSGTR